MKRIIISLVCTALLVSLVLVLLPAHPAIAFEGPTTAPPGGVTIVDTDPGDGEQWGRIGGRTLEFYNLDLSQFDQLLWGPVGLFAVKVAFDGAVDEPGEILTYSGNPTPGVLIWTGDTDVTLQGSCSGTYSVDTRFQMTVSDANGDPVVFVTHPTTSLPQVNVKALLPDLSGLLFAAKLEIFAKNPVVCYANDCLPAYQTPVGEFGPALNVFDCLNTDPAQEGDALTQYDWGFFYELTGVGPSLAEHDAHIAGLIDGVQATTDDISAKVGFLYEDWGFVMPGLRQDHGEILQGVSAVEGKLDAQGPKFGQIQQGISALEGKLDTQGSVLENVQQNMDKLNSLPNLQLLLLLFGIEADEVGMPPDPNLPPFEFVEQISDLYVAIGALEAKADSLETKIDDLGMKMDQIIELINKLDLKPGNGPKK